MNIFGDSIMTDIFNRTELSTNARMYINEYNFVLGNWNAGTPPGENATIPEPAGAMILTAACAALTARRRSRL